MPKNKNKLSDILNPMGSLTLPLEKSIDLNEVGGKAFNLQRLFALNISVPKGYVISPSTLNKITKNKSTKETLLVELLDSLTFPLIVRSSATLEDSEFLSFAGIFNSFGPITDKNSLANALIEISKTAESAQVKSYLAHYNIAPNALSLSAIVQEYKSPMYSGVVFTEHPDTPNSLLIEFGSGKNTVVGGALSFEIIVNKKTLSISGIGRDMLPENILKELIQVAKFIEDKFISAQDIEWVYDGSKLYIVQSRPIVKITVSKDKVIDNEKLRLINSLGQKPPRLTQNTIALGVSSITPVTLSLLERIYSKEGPLGATYKKFWFPIKSFNPKRYVISVCGRLYANSDLEETLIPKINKSWLKTKFQLQLFWDLRRLNKKLRRISLTETSIESSINTILKTTAPIVLRLSIYQNFLEQTIRNYYQEYVSEEVLNNSLRPTNSNFFFKTLEESNFNPKTALKSLGSRGLNELELASPRFQDNPESAIQFFKNISSPNADVYANTKKARQSLLEMTSGIWDKFKIDTYFTLFNRSAEIRELAHHMFVKSLTNLRSSLITYDERNGLYNSIWYASLDEILSHRIPDKQILFDRKSALEYLQNINLPAELNLNSWDELGVSHDNSDKHKNLNGVGLVSGLAEGVAITLDELQKNPIPEAILIVENLDPSIAMLLGKVKAVITERGGKLAHASLVAREFNVPIVRLDGARRFVLSGHKVKVNGTEGNVEYV